MSVSRDLLTKAAQEFKSGGTSDEDGKPSLQFFKRGPLEAAKLYFAQQFDTAEVPLTDLGSIRMVDIPSNFFGPLVFYALLTSAGEVEIIDYVYDPDYWNLVNDDPLD